MCRLLGITNFDFERHQELVQRFCDLAAIGRVMAGDPPGHGDGWGLAYYVDGNLVVDKSGGNLLEERDRVIGALQRARTSPVVILHLRKSAWKDTSSTRHAHPFHYGNVAFVHNGVVYGYQNLLPDLAIPVSEDALDTEVFFYHFMSAGGRDLGEAFLGTVSLIKREYTFSALNCLFSEGVKLYAYRDYSKEPDYYSLYRAQAEESFIVSSEPLDQGLQWEMMAKEEFAVFP